MEKYNPETDLCEESLEKALIECFGSKYHQFGLAQLLDLENQQQLAPSESS